MWTLLYSNTAVSSAHSHSGMATPDGGMPVSWNLIILTQLSYSPPVQTNRTVLPVGTGKYVEREGSNCSFKAWWAGVEVG